MKEEVNTNNGEGKEKLSPLNKFYEVLNSLSLDSSDKLTISVAAHDLSLEQWTNGYKESSENNSLITQKILG